MSRIMATDEQTACGIRRLMMWQARRQYGYVPGTFKLILPILQVVIPVGRVYDYLHLR